MIFRSQGTHRTTATILIPSTVTTETVPTHSKRPRGTGCHCAQFVPRALEALDWELGHVRRRLKPASDSSGRSPCQAKCGCAEGRDLGVRAVALNFVPVCRAKHPGHKAVILETVRFLLVSTPPPRPSCSQGNTQQRDPPSPPTEKQSARAPRPPWHASETEQNLQAHLQQT